MCQCTAGNKINADLTDLLDIFFCDVSGAFCLCSSVDQFNCLFHYFRCHVVEHDDVCSCLYCFFNLIQSLYLDLDLADKRCVSFCHLNGFCDTSCCSDVVVFKKDSIRKIISVITAASDSYCVFLKYTAVWCGLTGIKKSYIASLEKFCNLSGVGRDTAHSLKIVECYSLSGKENTDVTCYRCHQITFFDFITVFAVKIDLCFFVKDCKYSCVNVKTCYNTIFFCDKVYGSLSCSRHNCVCGNVLACDIFL